MYWYTVGDILESTAYAVSFAVTWCTTKAMIMLSHLLSFSDVKNVGVNVSLSSNHGIIVYYALNNT